MDTKNEVLRLNNKNACQNSDIPTKIILENAVSICRIFMSLHKWFDKIIYTPVILESGRFIKKV